ncbi:MAG: hypothetical protein RMK89_04175 [Armatimonadota bacterium]|nr:hypothetical protein [Armatimonadota bacterium]MDW8142643.1 hypothetical protein [Armatimonadota bacterium]
MTRLARQANIRRMVFYPMAGGAEGQFIALLTVLRFIKDNHPTRVDFLDWFMKQFDAKREFSRHVLEKVLKGSGLVIYRRKKLYLASEGEQVLDNAQPKLLLDCFMKHYGGFEELFEVVKGKAKPLRDIFPQWWEKVRQNYPNVASWSRQHALSQFNHRLNWLRSLGFVVTMGGDYLLSQGGLKVYTELLRRKVASPEEARRISHSDLEEKMRFIGEFFQFEVRKRPSVNEIFPQGAYRLKEERQLDCLWVRTIHFAGKLQYPIEIQIAGSIADTIERLEMVVNFIQKAIVITDQEQQERIRERLKAKRSPLIDKIVFVDIDDVDKIVEAATIMKAFVEKVFG